MSGCKQKTVIHTRKPTKSTMIVVGHIGLSVAMMISTSNQLL